MRSSRRPRPPTGVPAEEAVVRPTSPRPSYPTSGRRWSTSVAGPLVTATGHSDAIVTEDLAAARRFVADVDSAAVLVNASTRFTDGGEFGVGAELGISTQKLQPAGRCDCRR